MSRKLRRDASMPPDASKTNARQSAARTRRDRGALARLAICLARLRVAVRLLFLFLDMCSPLRCAAVVCRCPRALPILGAWSGAIGSLALRFGHSEVVEDGRSR